MKKILFYPGAFDPPHFGHVSAVTVALNNLNFDEIWIMTGGKRDDKVIPTSYEDRKNLGEIFVEYLQTKVKIPVKLLAVSPDKYIHEFIMELLAQPKNEISQLNGIDGYMGIKKRIIGPNEKHLIIKRSGYTIPEELISNDNLIFLDEGVGGISSTKIRDMVKNNDIKFKELVPEKISAYIDEKGLYL
jgi:nicotinic acid mononucleotide adenylyltransferase